MTPMILVFFFTFVTFFFLGFFVSALNYKKTYNVTYNPKNMFPYELNYEASFKNNFLGNILFILSIVSALAFVIFSSRSTANGLIWLYTASGALSSVLMAMVIFTPLKSLRGHLAADIFYFISVLLTLLSIALITLRVYNEYLETKSLVVCIVFFSIAAIYAIFLFNPKLSKWARLEEVKNSDGTSYYKRPKFFPLAYTEWLSFIFQMIALLGFLLVILLKIL